MTHLDWQSTTSEILLNPRMPEEQKVIFEKVLDCADEFPAHIWLCTSGSNKLKLVGLSKEALLVSAQAVNAYLKSDEKDVWVNPLPVFHVGGLGIVARSHLSHAKLCTYDGKWDAKEYHDFLINTRATLTALVPTQVFDLVKCQLPSPKSLRGVIVGGGSLSHSLYESAMCLGWPLMPSYGLTEGASQVATAAVGDSRLKILSHLEVKVTSEGFIAIKGRSVLSTYVIEKSGGLVFVDPKKDGFFVTEDLGSVQEGFLQVHGRRGNFVKVGGENVDVGRLEDILEDIKLKNKFEWDWMLLPVADERLGHVLHLICDAKSRSSVEVALDEFHARVMPFERVRHFDLVETIAKTPLGKKIRK